MMSLRRRFFEARLQCFELCSELVKPVDKSMNEYSSHRCFAVNIITQT